MGDRKELFKKVEGKLHNFKNLDVQIKNIELKIIQEKNTYRGCGAISYSERTGVTYNISRSVEKEVIEKDKRIGKLLESKLNKEIEKQQIENALTCLDANEIEFFDLFYNSKSNPSMTYISIQLHMNRSHCYSIRERIVYKIMGMLYPEYEELPLLNANQHFDDTLATN